MPTIRHLSALLLVALAGATPAAAETVLGLYGGVQTAPHSTLRLNGDRMTARWEGRSLTAPPYWGARLTRWNGDIGWGAEITHAKIYADDATLARAGTPHLEFSDGMNLLTLNALRRWPGGRLTPYAGGGIGISVPHVEVGDGPDRTFGYQMTGPALRLFAGVSWDIGDHWQAMAEYQGTWSRHDADLTGGGRLQTNIVTNAVNLGLGWRF